MEIKKSGSKKVQTANFGMHLMLDAYGANPAPLDDMRTVYRFLDSLPGKIGMHKLMNPIVVDALPTDTGKDPGGVTGFVLIAESHISIHTFPRRKFFTLDLYSCNNFSDDDVKKIMSFILGTFGYKKKNYELLKED